MVQAININKQQQTGSELYYLMLQLDCNLCCIISMVKALGAFLLHLYLLLHILALFNNRTSTASGAL